MIYRGSPNYDQDCTDPDYLKTVQETDRFFLQLQEQQRATYVRSFVRESPPGTETTSGYRECTHCTQRTHWEAGSVLHAPGCPIGSW